MAVFRRYRVWIGVACIAALFVGICSRAAFVPDDSMSPSLLPGDLVFILPTRTAVDDVVAVVDPLDPTVWTLRRVEAIGGAIRYTGGSFVIEQAPQLLDMGLDENGFSVIQEADHLTRHLVRNISWEMDEVGVPDESSWLGADNRDIAIDSRWWGPVPLVALRGTVVLRVGPPRNRWRGWFDLSP